MKSSNKTRFDIDVLNAIRNRDKHYKKLKQSGQEIDKDNLKYAKLTYKSTKLLINNKKILYFEEKICKK